jgi:hypothetical protein
MITLDAHLTILDEMLPFTRHTSWLILLIAVSSAGAAEEPALVGQRPVRTEQVEYNRDIRPILSRSCFPCHGFDAQQREAGLRLDVSEEACRPTASGVTPIMPGKPELSEVVARICSEDASTVMPPREVKKDLSPRETRLIKQWILEGAAYQPIWSLIPPRRQGVPAIRQTNRGWPRNAIDYFIDARLEQAELLPAAEADRPALIRRLSFDLTGLPPTLDEVDAFLSDTAPDAYEQLVDRLLASPHFGERMAVMWLDAARFADTHGYHLDAGRDMTIWRKWVIDAFNRNLPFDRFTVEQLAGDLLPEATVEHKIASGFNRNHMINFEGGAIGEEYRTAYVADRVNTVSTVWLGLTMGCCQCHDHKFDPFTQHDYYRLFAFFNNLDEKGIDGEVGNCEPLLRFPTPPQQIKLTELTTAIAAIKQQIVPQPAKRKKARTARLEKQLADLEQELADLQDKIPSAMIMAEMDRPRDTFVLVRGQYDQLGEKVTAAVPAALPPLPANPPPNRLGLAQWLVDPSHPLVARVTVNRLWQMLFGNGLVKSSEDFGSQGDLPSHPDLLDWLAIEFVEPSPAPLGTASSSKWNIKAMVRLMVTSATYRQTSALTSKRRDRDPENRLYSHLSRTRLPAEFIRDQALAVSGLLQHRIGGPSVSPYQPAGLWEELNSLEKMGSREQKWSRRFYQQSHGPDLYRRGMYTIWKRTAPAPSMSAFDAPDRENCAVRRANSNTPLQALVLLNDPTYVEAARKLAERVLAEAPNDLNDRLAYLFRLTLCRPPSKAECAVLEATLEDQLGRFRNRPSAARELLQVGESSRNEQLDLVEHAAWTNLASVVLNLDEAITRN